MDTLRTGIVGCGKVADFHAGALHNLPVSAFAAVCDSDVNRAQALADRYHVKAYGDIEEMIRAEKLQMICICTPHPLHARLAVRAADLGCHVLIEKPLAVSLEDCDRMIEAGDRNHVTIGTIVQRRFYRPCMRMKEAIDQGKIGTPIIGTVNMLGWRDQHYYNSDPWRGSWDGEGGGVMATQATHQIDLLLWYMGEADEVYGIWKNYNHPYIEVEDTAVAVVKFKNGSIGNLVMSNSQNPALYGKVHIHGSNGASIGVQTDGGAMFIAGMSDITEAPYNDLWTVAGEADRLEQMRQEDTEAFFSVDSMRYYHERQIEEFIQAVLDNRAPLVDAREGRRTVELFTAVYQSSKLNRPVKLPAAHG